MISRETVVVRTRTEGIRKEKERSGPRDILEVKLTVVEINRTWGDEREGAAGCWGDSQVQAGQEICQVRCTGGGLVMASLEDKLGLQHLCDM